MKKVSMNGEEFYFKESMLEFKGGTLDFKESDSLCTLTKDDEALIDLKKDGRFLVRNAEPISDEDTVAVLREWMTHMAKQFGAL